MITDDPLCAERPDYCEGWRDGYRHGAISFGALIGTICLIVGFGIGIL